MTEDLGIDRAGISGKHRVRIACRELKRYIHEGTWVRLKGGTTQASDGERLWENEGERKYPQVWKGNRRRIVDIIAPGG